MRKGVIGLERRFRLIKAENEERLISLIKEKSLSHEDLELILVSLKINPAVLNSDILNSQK